MKDAEKKLYGVIDHNELVYGKLLGSGGFGEVCVFKKKPFFQIKTLIIHCMFRTQTQNSSPSYTYT